MFNVLLRVFSKEVFLFFFFLFLSMEISFIEKEKVFKHETYDFKLFLYTLFKLKINWGRFY